MITFILIVFLIFFMYIIGIIIDMSIVNAKINDKYRLFNMALQLKASPEHLDELLTNIESSKSIPEVFYLQGIDVDKLKQYDVL